ncbi:MAG: DEAD/DEAH box helicase [Erysipelotrichaceae bacterium]
MNQYQDYQLKDYTKALIEKNKFKTPTPIQREVIPAACKGRDIIGISDTGTGKTHAFLIPVLEMIDASIPEIQAVITAPTRELALQLFLRAQEMCEFVEGLNIKLIVGGKEKTRMMEQLKTQPQIVIGTPGRIRDLFLNEGVLRVDSAKMFVVDEADMTLEFGFLEDVDAICGRMDHHLQMMSFSATMPLELQHFLKKYMQEPKVIEIHQAESFAPNIAHVLVPCRHKSYDEALLDILKGFDPYVCLIFANTRDQAKRTAQMMRDHDIPVIELHGSLTPRERTKAMKELNTSEKRYVVATDIAARGIDIDGVSHIVSLGFPKEIEFYIHRSGRTGRAGHSGICYALYQQQDMGAIRTLEKQGISFAHKTFKNNQWNELKPLHEKKIIKNDPLTNEIARLVTHKKQKVKPGYKKKQSIEIEKMRRHAKRNMIQEDIKRQKKERARKYQIEKNGEDKK